MQLEELLTDSYRESSDRPISIALATSLCVHALLIVSLVLLLNSDSVPGTLDESPAISIFLVTRNTPIESGRDSDRATEESELIQAALTMAGDANPDATSRVQNSSSSTTPITAEANQTMALERQDVSRESAQDPSGPELEMLSEPGEPVVATTAVREYFASRPMIEPVLDILVQRPLMPQQKQMLDNKLKQWVQNIDQLANDGELISWKHGDQTYSASLKRVPAKNDTDFERAIVKVSTEIDGVEMSTEMQLKRLAFSHFAQLIDRWDPSVSFSRDIIEGRFHSNSRIFIDPDRRRETRFEGKVTIASTIKFISYSRRADIFRGGLETRVRKIPLPRSDLAFDVLAKTAADTAHVFEENTDIVFQPGGEFTWSAKSFPDTVHTRTVAAGANYIIGANDAKLTVSGTVNGAVIVYSPTRITIVGDLIYARDPEKFPDSTDYLGLLSEGNVEIAGPRITGRGNLTVQAAIYAKRRFVVRGHRVRSNGVLAIYGSVTAGSLSATEPRFATRLRFDKRLEVKRPPGFPMTGRFELESWDPKWTQSGT